MPSGVNLMPESRRIARRQRQRAAAWFAGTTVYAFVVGAVWLGVHLTWADEHSVVAAEIDTLRRQMDEDRLAAAKLQPRLSAAVATLAASRSIGNQPDWSLLLGLLAGQLGDDTVLSTCELTPANRRDAAAGAPVREYTLRLTGLGRSHASVLAYVRKLETCGLFARVTLIETRPESFGGRSAIGFSMECALHEAREGAG